MAETETEHPVINYIREQMEEGHTLIPSYMWDGVKNYVLHGIPNGRFLTLVFSNAPFMDVLGAADDQNQRHILGWTKFIYNHVPSGCWGSQEIVDKWCASGGLYGQEEAKA